MGAKWQVEYDRRTRAVLRGRLNPSRMALAVRQVLADLFLQGKIPQAEFDASFPIKTRSQPKLVDLSGVHRSTASLLKDSTFQIHRGGRVVAPRRRRNG